MRGFILGLAALSLMGCATARAESGVAGTWNLSTTIAHETTTVTLCDFVQTGSALSGGCGPVDRSHAPHPITGVVTGNDVTWTLTTEFQGRPITTTWRGALSGDRITGASTILEHPDVPGEFTATRAR